METYIPKDIVLVVGVVPVTGFADGTFINVEQVNDETTFHYGIDGVSRSISGDGAYRITFTLRQSSLSNDALTLMFKTDRQTKGIVPVPLTIQDLNGTSKLASPSIGLERYPAQPFAKEISPREWSVIATDCVFNVGGALTALV